ncbi:MAG: hypothetical protein ACKVQK_30410 [Burkholderiales bacterium]
MKWWLIYGVGMFAAGMSFSWILTYLATTSDASRGTPTTVLFLIFVVVLPTLVVLVYRSIQATLAPLGFSAYQRSLPLLVIVSLFIIGVTGCALAIMGYSGML